MKNNSTIRKLGDVTETLPDTKFRVTLHDTGEEVLCHLAGKLRIHRIRVLPGDVVTVEMAPEPSGAAKKRGRIVYRGKK